MWLRSNNTALWSTELQKDWMFPEEVISGEKEGEEKKKIFLIRSNLLRQHSSHIWHSLYSLESFEALERWQMTEVRKRGVEWTVVSVSQTQRINLTFWRWNKIHFQEKEIELGNARHIATEKDIQMYNHYSKLDGIFHRYVWKACSTIVKIHASLCWCSWKQQEIHG